MGKILLELSFPNNEDSTSRISDKGGEIATDTKIIEEPVRRSGLPNTTNLDDESKAIVEHIRLAVEPRHYPRLSPRILDSQLPFLPAAEVAKRNGQEGIVVDDMVLDCTDFQKVHPGGRAIIQGFGGQDCSWQVRLGIPAALPVTHIKTVVVVPRKRSHGKVWEGSSCSKDEWSSKPTPEARSSLLSVEDSYRTVVITALMKE